MTAAQLVKTLAQSAIEFLAKKHGVTVEQITEAIDAGNQRVIRQAAELMIAAAEATGHEITVK